MSVAVVYNKSIESSFMGMAHSLQKEFQNLGLACEVLDNVSLSSIPDKEVCFDKCVYFDKDPVQGLRLELLGVRLFNNIGAIELCDDKRKCSEFLRRDFPIPETVCYPLLFRPAEEFFEAFTQEIIQKLGLPLVAKKAFGSWGEQVFLLETKEEVYRFQQKNWNIPHLYCRYIRASRGKDLRVYVVGENVAGAMLRENERDFRSNIGCGGAGKAYPVRPETQKLAVDVCRALSLDFGGVDLLFCEDGTFAVCEVNSNAMFTAIDQVCHINIAAQIAGHVAKTELFSAGFDSL